MTRHYVEVDAEATIVRTTVHPSSNLHDRLARELARERPAAGLYRLSFPVGLPKIGREVADPLREAERIAQQTRERAERQLAKPRWRRRDTWSMDTRSTHLAAWLRGECPYVI